MRFRLSATIILLAIAFTSCQKDFAVETAPIAGVGGANGCKDCIYYPVCSGSVYKYSDTAAGSSTGTAFNYTLTYIKDSTIENKTYKKFTGAGQQNSFFNCTAGVSTTIILNGSTQGGILLPYVKITTLKENGAVGTSWTDTLTAGGQQALYTYTIVSKGTPRTVAGVTYPDAIYVKEQTTIDLMGNTINAGRSDYYFARGVGLIESISFDDFTGTQLLHRVLTSASIP